MKIRDRLEYHWYDLWIYDNEDNGDEGQGNTPLAALMAAKEKKT